MHADELLGLSAAGDKIFNQAIRVEAKLVRVQPEVIKPAGTKLGGVAMADGILFLIPICSMMIWAIVVFRLSGFWKVPRNGAVSIKTCAQVPCRNCRFFTNNPFLKCAVNPSIALTQQALNCSDYSPHDGQ